MSGPSGLTTLGRELSAGRRSLGKDSTSPSRGGRRACAPGGGSAHAGSIRAHPPNYYRPRCSKPEEREIHSSSDGNRALYRGAIGVSTSALHHRSRLRLSDGSRRSRRCARRSEPDGGSEIPLALAREDVARASSPGVLQSCEVGERSHWPSEKNTTPSSHPARFRAPTSPSRRGLCASDRA